MKVLLADSDERFVELAQAYLWECGHETEIATTSLECLITLREFAPDVLVLDYDLLWDVSEGVDLVLDDDSGSAPPSVIVMTDAVPSDRAYNAAGSLSIEWLRRPFWLPELETCLQAVRSRQTFLKADAELY